MPTYEYRCTKCKHAFEQFQSITAKPIRKCPACGKNGAERQLSTGAGFIFKGSGFYITDYRSESYKKAAEADKSAAAGSPAGGSSGGGNGGTGTAGGGEASAKPAAAAAAPAGGGGAKAEKASKPAAAGGGAKKKKG